MTELPLRLMAPQVMMDRLVRERLERLMPSSIMLNKDYTLWVILFLDIFCVFSVDLVNKLKGRFEVVQMVRVIVIAYIYRFMQSRFGHNKVPLVYYLRKVLLFHDLPITVLVSASYTVIRTSPRPLDDSLVSVSMFLQVFILVFMPKGMELEQYINTPEASCLNTELVPRQSYDAADLDVHVTDHFVIILLAGLCVDLNVQLERLDGKYENPAPFCIVLATMHASRYLQLRQGGNEVPPVYYQQKTILSYDIPITAAIAGERLNQTESHDAGFLFVHDAFIWIEDALNADSIYDTSNSSRWIHKDCIGSGGFGAVFVAENRETQAIGAVKVLKDNDIPEHVESIRKEIEFLTQLEHPNIVKYFDHEIVGGDIYLYMEYIQPGSLRKYISDHGVLHEPLIRHFTSQILSGLVYLHSVRVVHRDIKPDNILVNPNNTIKLADFGLAKHLNDSVGNHSKLGTYPYAAPEVLRKGVYNSSPEAYAADIWSLGCVIIEMFTGQIPWPDSKMEDPLIEELCTECKDFLERCFKKNPDERASAEDLLGHPFVIGTN